MADEGIIRDATETEKKDFLEIGKNLSFEQRFQQELARVEARYTKEHKPFDRLGAYHDYQDRKDETLKRLERQYGPGAEGYLKYSDLTTDLEKYGKPDRFKLLDEAEVTEEKLLDGIRTPVITGKNMNYQCVKHKGRITVFVPFLRVKRVDELPAK
jgi:hypothetical protein